MKKLLTILLALALVFSLTACSGFSREKDEKETAEESVAEEEEDDDEEVDEDSSEEEKSSKKTETAKEKSSAKTLTGISYDFKGNGNDPGNLYDFRSIVFYEDTFFVYEDEAIYRIPTEGGTAQIVCAVEEAARNFSIADEYLYFSMGEKIARVPIDGGEPEILNDVNDQGYVDLGGMMIYNGLLFYTYCYGYESLSINTYSILEAMDPETGEIMSWPIGDFDSGFGNTIWGSKEGIYSAKTYEGQMFFYPWSACTKDTCVGAENAPERIESYSFRVNDSDSDMFGSDARIYELEDGTVGIYEYKGRLDDKQKENTSEPDKVLYSYEQNGSTSFFKSMCKYELSSCYVGVGLNRGSIATYDKDFQPIETLEEIHPNAGGGVAGKYKDHVYYFSITEHYEEGREYALFVIDKEGSIEERAISLG